MQSKILCVVLSRRKMGRGSERKKGREKGKKERERGGEEIKKG